MECRETEPPERLTHVAVSAVVRKDSALSHEVTAVLQLTLFANARSAVEVDIRLPQMQKEKYEEFSRHWRGLLDGTNRMVHYDTTDEQLLEWMNRHLPESLQAVRQHIMDVVWREESTG